MTKRKGACALVFRKTNGVAEFLTLHRSTPWQGWEFPKGGIEPNETEDDAIERELKEELGTKKFKVLGKAPFFLEYTWDEATKDHYNFRFNGARHRMFLAEFLGKDEDIKVSDEEHDRFKWLPADKIMVQLNFEDLREVFKKMLYTFPQYFKP